MAATYVQLTREEFEQWLGTLGHPWHLKSGKVGIYVVKLSQNVAIDVSSSMTGRDDVVNRAQASMGVKLVSLVTGQTLNKKAQEQSHVKRTTNWRDNLRKVFDRMLDAYRKAESFYEALAEIEDRDQYKADVLMKIEAIPEWGANQFLADLHTRVTGGSILTRRQMDALSRAAEPKPPPAPPADGLARLRALWAVARREGDTAAMKAAEAAAAVVKRGQDLNDADAAQMRTLMDKYRSAIGTWINENQEKATRVADTWFAMTRLAARFAGQSTP